MTKEQQIIEKIRIMVSRHFEDPADAFNYFDGNSDGALSKKELKKMLKQAKVSGLIRGLVSKEMIKKLDTNKGKTLEWNEFEKVAKDLMQKKKKKKKSKKPKAKTAPETIDSKPEATAEKRDPELDSVKE